VYLSIISVELLIKTLWLPRVVISSIFWRNNYEKLIDDLNQALTISRSTLNFPMEGGTSLRVAVLNSERFVDNQGNLRSSSSRPRFILFAQNIPQFSTSDKEVALDQTASVS